MASPTFCSSPGSAATPPPRPSTPCATVTDTVSVVYVTAWRPSEGVRADWERRGLHGEFLDAADLDAAVRAAAALHGRLPLHGVVTYSELLLRPQAEIAGRLGLPGNPPEAVTVAQSKARQRLVFAEHGVPSPASRSSPATGTSPRPPHASGCPAVFKPSLGAGSQCVRLVSTLLGTDPRLHRDACREDSLPAVRRRLSAGGAAGAGGRRRQRLRGLLQRGVAARRRRRPPPRRLRPAAPGTRLRRGGRRRCPPGWTRRARQPSSTSPTGPSGRSG